ncbi:UDP-N-acetylenolpyruvoylglucosamine reductase [Thalassotalea profundi]|uniref:UDP-N-acetylenolpyruvoylglucosamine reductase n=1 Tax=Thalassotalea profundi TaxID=2036687 RepID=A0ABQ3J939_9GAMM|nr:UDP-N-acetylenolpyruvoylglucosamine reductase [Thalassotalea profundi]
MSLKNFYILGEGSNTLFLSHTAPVIIQPKFMGIEIKEDENFYFITAGSGENWHQLVTYCVNNGYAGLENLALIPGSVGAAPIQNIGAYGVEISDVIDAVYWYELATQHLHKFSKEQCQFAYRDSIFKQQLRDKGIITKVILKLPKVWQANISYQGLDLLDTDPTVEQVYQRVIEVRQAKLPDPKFKPNAGSFFKNPVVDLKTYQRLAQQYPNMPAYVQANKEVKLAAGWLIEQAGFKGIKKNGVGVHDKQALVLVNHGDGSGEAIYQLALEINQKVYEKFGIYLQPEVRIVASNGFIGNGEFHG